MRLLGHTDARDIAGQPTALGETGVIATLKVGLARDGVYALSSAGSVDVLVAACSSAAVEVGAVL
jgi:hypothetical protein